MNGVALKECFRDNAMGQYNRIADEILTLDTFPERFRIMDSEPENRMELRRMLVIIIQCFTQSVTKEELDWMCYTTADIEARLRGEL